MNNAFILFVNIMVMLLYSLPGFVLVKRKMLKPDAISGFNILLLYVTQPCLSYYALTKVPFEKQIFVNMLYTFGVSLGIMLAIIAVFHLFTKKQQKSNVSLRISNIAIAFGNCTFMGIPLLEALLPHYPEAAMYSIVFFISMSIIGWTVASYIITCDKKYISIKKIFINPAIIGLVASLPFFLTGVPLPDTFHNAVILLGKMSTPICMLILGMRLATLSFKPIFTDKSKYMSMCVRQLLGPMLYILICFILPIEPDLKFTIVICGATPTAAAVLNFAELLGEGQEYAAGSIVLSTISALITMPIMIFLATAMLG